MQTIENSLLQVSVDENGAQLVHFMSKTGKYDFLQDKEQQERLTIAFPAIEKDRNWALKLPWTVVDKGDVRMSLTMIDTPKSYKVFPYHFEVMITYVIEGNQLQIEFYVKNNSNKEMPFSASLLLTLLKGWQGKAGTNQLQLSGPDQRQAKLESTDFKFKTDQQKIVASSNEVKLKGEGEQTFKLSLVLA